MKLAKLALRFKYYAIAAVYISGSSYYLNVYFILSSAYSFCLLNK